MGPASPLPREAHLRTRASEETRSSSDRRSRRRKFRRVTAGIRTGIRKPAFAERSTSVRQKPDGSRNLQLPYKPRDTTTGIGPQRSPTFLPARSQPVARREPQDRPASQPVPPPPHGPQGGRPGRRTRHPVPARDEGGAQENTLERTPPGRGGEFELTDALQEPVAGGKVHGVVFDGLR